jgi:hypothetical protein
MFYRILGTNCQHVKWIEKDQGRLLCNLCNGGRKDILHRLNNLSLNACAVDRFCCFKHNYYSHKAPQVNTLLYLPDSLSRFVRDT